MNSLPKDNMSHFDDRTFLSFVERITFLCLVSLTHYLANFGMEDTILDSYQNTSKGHLEKGWSAQCMTNFRMQRQPKRSSGKGTPMSQTTFHTVFMWSDRFSQQEKGHPTHQLLNVGGGKGNAQTRTIPFPSHSAMKPIPFNSNGTSIACRDAERILSKTM